MSISYSAAAQSAPQEPKANPRVVETPKDTLETITDQSGANPTTHSPTLKPATFNQDDQPEAGPSRPRIRHLILDAGPLLSLTPLRHLAESFYTTPAVLAELRDPKAREHWERLGLSRVDVKVEQPKSEWMAKVISFSKKTGDYSVLSQTDLGVVALTLQYEALENGEGRIRYEPRQNISQPKSNNKLAKQQNQEQDHRMEESESLEPKEEASGEIEQEDEGSESPSPDEAEDEDLPQDGEAISEEPKLNSPIPRLPSSTETPSTQHTAEPSDHKDIDDESDGGEWITPSNLSSHRSKDLGLLPTDHSKSGGKKAEQVMSACMTGDFAVQNILLGMGLGLVGEGGKRIGKVKSWVLRCHACFKICKDSSKKFCPSCGNPSLLRTTITTTSSGSTQIHLKKNFQYKLRGTKYSIPDAKPGSAKGQIKSGTGLILREDQREWVDAVRSEGIRKGKEEKKILKGWDDPDWMPEIITVGMSGKGRTGPNGLPTIGHGRKNPNIAKKKR